MFTTLIALVAVSQSPSTGLLPFPSAQAVIQTAPQSDVPDREAAILAFEEDRYEEAWRGLAHLAGGDDHVADFCVAYMQCLGLGTELDVPTGAKGYLRAGKGGVLQGLSNLSAIFENGAGLPYDPRKAIDLRILLAYRGRVESAMDIGYAYALGIGRPEDLIEGYAWTAIAVDLGQDATHNLELMTKNLAPLQLVRAKRRHRALESELLGEQAPERPVPDYPSIDEAPLRASVTLEDGHAASAEGDKRMALRIFQAVGENGDAVAAFHAGLLLEDRDPGEAFVWFQRAATLGDLDGAYRAGLALVLGEGCEKDLAAGTTWLEKAANGGVTAAAEALAHVALSK